MRPYMAEIAAVADTLVIAYPNAGLPNAMGEYDEGPHEMACQLGPWAKDGLLNIVGGCCGSTPEHIAEIAAHVAKYPPRKVPQDRAPHAPLRPRALRARVSIFMPDKPNRWDEHRLPHARPVPSPLGERARVRGPSFRPLDESFRSPRQSWRT